MAAVDGFRYVYRREVEFRDIDVAGHVNNAVYLTYLENARIGYLRAALGDEFLYELSLILARLTIDFRSPARLAEELSVGARIPRLGTKSFDMEHEIRAGDGRLVAEATSVLVAYDYEAGGPMPIPGEWRDRIETHEARSLTPQ
jgi:acyl-CoA thioester hydrolase